MQCYLIEQSPFLNSPYGFYLTVCQTNLFKSVDCVWSKQTCCTVHQQKLKYLLYANLGTCSSRIALGLNGLNAYDKGCNQQIAVCTVRITHIGDMEVNERWCLSVKQNWHFRTTGTFSITYIIRRINKSCQVDSFILWRWETCRIY